MKRKKKKNLPNLIVRLTGEWKKFFWKILEKFWLFLEFFGKYTFFETSHYTTILKIQEFEEEKKIIVRFSREKKSSEKTDMIV